MKIYLVFLVMLGTHAYAMERLSLKESKKIEGLALVVNKSLFNTLQEWGYLQVIRQVEVWRPAKPHSVVESIACLPCVQKVDISLLLQILSYLDYPENPLERENKVIDICNWVFDRAEDIRALINKIPKKEDGTVDKPLVQKRIKKQYKEYSATLMKLGKPQAACVLSNELVSFFPFLSAVIKFNTEPFLKDTTRQSAVLFKKLLTLIHNHSIKLYGLQGSFDTVNEMSDGESDKLLKKKILKGLSSLEKGPQTLKQVAELWEMAHFCGIKPLCKALLKMLDSWDRLYLKEFIMALPNEHLQWICSFIGKSNFVACVIAQKLSLIRSHTKLSVADQLIADSLEALAQIVCRLKLSPNKSPLAGGMQEGTHWVHTYNVKKIYRLFYKRDVPYNRIWFYELLDSELKNALKKILIEKFMMPTSVRHAKLDINGAYKADRSLNGDEEIFYFSPNSVYMCSCANNDFVDPDYDLWEYTVPSSYIARFSLGNKLEVPYVMAGMSDGTVCLKECDSSDAVRMTILPQPHWGGVTALCDTRTSVIVAYESGAVEQFPIPLTQESLVTIQSNTCNSMAEKCFVELEKGRTIVNDSGKDKPLTGKTNYCHLLVANKKCIVGAFKEGSLRVWEKKKIKQSINLPVTCEITCMHLMANHQIAIGCNNGVAYVIDLVTGNVRNRCELKNFCKSNVTALAQLGETGTFLCVGYENGLVYLWDLISGKVKKTIDGQDRGSVVGLIVSRHNSSVLEVFYSDGLIMRYFFPDYAALEEIIQVIRRQSLY